MNRAAHLFRQAQEQPDATALVFSDRTITFGQWWDEARAMPTA